MIDFKRYDLNGNLIAVRIQKAATLLGPLPYDQWPIWAKAFRALATKDDKGVGDVIARIIGHENSEKFKAWHLETFGKPCNCAGRQARLNALYPFK